MLLGRRFDVEDRCGSLGAISLFLILIQSHVALPDWIVIDFYRRLPVWFDIDSSYYGRVIIPSRHRWRRLCSDECCISCHCCRRNGTSVLSLMSSLTCQ